MDQYAIIGISKLKTAANIQGVLAHMSRERETANADPGRRHQNDVLISPPKVSEVMDLLHTYLPRKNAVLAYDFLLTASPEFFLDKNETEIRAWERDSLAWCWETFGRDNVIAAICHRDESTPHIQLLIVPDHEGRLNARYYTGGREKLRALWSGYAAAMKPWGLQRGKMYSPAEHKQIKQYYADVKAATKQASKNKFVVTPEQLPEPKASERYDPKKYAAKIVNLLAARFALRDANVAAEITNLKKEVDRLTDLIAADRKLNSFLLAHPEIVENLKKMADEEQAKKMASENARRRIFKGRSM